MVGPQRMNPKWVIESQQEVNEDYSLKMVSHLPSRVWREQGASYSPAGWVPGKASNHLRFDDPLSQEAHHGSVRTRLVSEQAQCSQSIRQCSLL